MEYKRLTERNSVGLVDTLCKHCMFNGDCTKPRTHCDRAVRERLYELEDKIENGTLVLLKKPYIVLTKAEAEAKLRELKEKQNE